MPENNFFLDLYKAENFQSLKGQLLISMPYTKNLDYDQAVMYVYEHSAYGARGIVINYPAAITYSDLLDEMHIEHILYKHNQEPILMDGGPDKQGNGFVLHSLDFSVDSTKKIDCNLGLTESDDILPEIIWKKKPKHKIISLGHFIWESGELEKEIATNQWINLPADSEIMFNTPYKKRWEVSMNKLGLKSKFIAMEYGQA